MNSAEIELRRQARQAALKIKALDWLDEKSAGIPTSHSMSCNAEDMTGYPAPCSCGFDNNEDVKIIKLLKEALLKG